MIIEAGVRETSKNGTVLLWESSNAVAFNAQTVQVDLSAYKVIYITAVTNTSSSSSAKTSMILNNALLGQQAVWCGEGNRDAYRMVTVAPTGLQFSSGNIRTYNSDGTFSTTTSTAAAIPIRIYGGY